MNRVDTVCKIKCYEDGEDSQVDREIIELRSHWNHSERVVLVIKGKEHTVIASDLFEAIRRCSK